MTASRRRTVILLVAALGVAVILLAAATTGPSSLVGEVQAGTTQVQTSEDAPPPDAATDRPEDDRPPQGHPNDVGDWVQGLLVLALLVAGLVLASGVVRVVADRLARRLPDKQLVLDLDPLPDPEAARTALRVDRDRQAALLAATDVRNGIVACWVRLEETAAEVGVTRRPAETSTELVVRFLHAVDLDPRPVGLLATLYQEARFSSHELPPDARRRAQEALAAIHTDLDWGAVR